MMHRCGAATKSRNVVSSYQVPAGYRKVVRARVDGEVDTTTLLITPSHIEEVIQLGDGLVEVGEGQCVTLVVENHRPEALQLKRGMELGGVVPAEEVAGPKEKQEDGGE